MTFHLKEALSRKWHSIESGSRLEINEISRARRKVQIILAVDSLQKPTQVDLDATYKRMCKVRDSQLLMRDLTIREIREAAWLVFWKLGVNQQRFCDDTEFFSAYMARVRALNAPRSAISLVLSYLEAYPKSSEKFAEINSQIRRTLANCNSRADSLKDACDRNRLLYADAGEAIAQKILNDREDWQTVLQKAYLTDLRANLGLVEHVFCECCKRVEQTITNKTLSDRALSRYLQFAISGDGNSLRFDSRRVLLAESLLRPFIDKRPSQTIRAGILDFLLNQFGDPRTEPHKWQGITQILRAVVIKWLVEDTFDDFFRIVDLSQNLDSDADRQWRYRRAFWKAYFEFGVITDAWLVLGSGMRWEAKRRLDIDPDIYGSFRRGSGVRSSHAALILKIGGYVISEWSHVGKYRIWHEAAPSAPSLYKQQYGRHELVQGASLEGSHFSAESGLWQSNLSQAIRTRTNINLSRKQYMKGV